MRLPLVFLCAIGGSIVQTTTGFGCGIVMMTILSALFPLLQASAVNTAICIGLTVTLALRYRHHISVKKMLLPGIIYVLTNTITIRISTGLDLRALSIAFGVFLLILCAYFFFGKGKVTLPSSIPVAVFAASFSGITGGLFGIGGPLMALYFLGTTDTKEEYVGTLQGLFSISTVISTLTRIYRGIYTIDLLPATLCGIIGVVAGSLIGVRILRRINIRILSIMVYILMGVSGMITIGSNL